MEPASPVPTPLLLDPNSKVDLQQVTSALTKDQDLAHVGFASEGLNRTIRGDFEHAFHDCSTVIIIPERTPNFHVRVLNTWMNLIRPMNQPVVWLFAIGFEVGVAYDEYVEMVLSHPQLSKFQYVMTMESDNLQPPDALVKLIQTQRKFGFDGVSGIYFTKGEINMPMAYGDPAEYERDRVLRFNPLDIRGALEAGGSVLPVNGIANGCTLYTMNLLRKVGRPRFQSLADVVDGQPQGFTQDLYFCKRAIEQHGARFAVDLRVKVGHLDMASGVVY